MIGYHHVPFLLRKSSVAGNVDAHRVKNGLDHIVYTYPCCCAVIKNITTDFLNNSNRDELNNTKHQNGNGPKNGIQKITNKRYAAFDFRKQRHFSLLLNGELCYS
jgi:hypothetical protein